MRDLKQLKVCKRGHVTVKDGSTGWCSECRKASKRAYYWRNRKRMLKNANAYNRRHLLEKREYAKEYYRRVPRDKDKRLASHHKRRAAQLKSKSHYTKEDVLRILKRQNYKCVGIECTHSLKVSYSIDHKLPLSRGGSNHRNNIQLLCLHCNCQKKNKTMKEWRKWYAS